MVVNSLPVALGSANRASKARYEIGHLATRRGRIKGSGASIAAAHMLYNERISIMLVLSTLIFPQIILLCSILLAIVLGLLYLRRRGHLQSLQLIWFPLLGFAIFGICDALVTLEGTWQSPWREANPSMRAFLLWGGWWGQCL